MPYKNIPHRQAILIGLLISQLGALAILWFGYSSASLVIFLGMSIIFIMLLWITPETEHANPFEQQGLSMLTLGPDPVLVVSEAGKIVASNQAACSTFDVPLNEMAGHMIEDFMPVNSRKRHERMRGRFFESKGDVRMRNSVTGWTAKGNELELEVHLSFVEVQQQRYAIASIRDMSHFRKHEKLLRESEKRFRDTFEQAAIGMAHVALNGHFIRINSTVSRMFGYPQDKLLTLTFQDITHKEDLREDLANLDKLLRGEIEQYGMNKRYQHSHGHYVWCHLTVSLIRNDYGEPDYFIATIADISQQKAAEDLLTQSEQKFRTILESLSNEVSIWMSTPHLTKMLYVNRGYETIWGRPSAELYNNPRSFLDLIHPDDKHKVALHLQEHIKGDWNMDYRIVRDNGETRFIHDVGYNLYNNQKQLVCLIGTAFDRTLEVRRQAQLDDSLQQLKKAFQQLAESARIDNLTQTLNRKAIYEELQFEFNRYQRYQNATTLVFIDLNDFKKINDQYGHPVGDQALINVACHLKQQIREIDSLGRYGGDEFIILLRQTNADEAERFCQRILKQPVLIHLVASQVEFAITLSVGLHTLSKDIHSLEDWLRIADARMYHDKQEQKTTH